MRWPDDDLPRAAGEATVPPELLKAWGNPWTNRSELHALQQEDGTYRWVYQPGDTAVLSGHLAGSCTVALSSLGVDGSCRWLCLDADQADALPQLRELAFALAEVGLPGLVEANRRGGHLWLLLDAPTSAAIARRVLPHELNDLRAAGLHIPSYELYPDLAVVGMLGHAVRLPLGIHRLTGKRYALFDENRYRCAFTFSRRGGPSRSVGGSAAFSPVRDKETVRRHPRSPGDHAVHPHSFPPPRHGGVAGRNRCPRTRGCVRTRWGPRGRTPVRTPVPSGWGSAATRGAVVVPWTRQAPRAHDSISAQLPPHVRLIPLPYIDAAMGRCT
jgi:hypothetical protein